MFFDGYKELEDSVVKWMDREDIRDEVPQFTRFVTNHIARTLRVQIMERRVVLPVYGDGSVYIPSDLLESISVTWLSYEVDDTTQAISHVTDRKPLERGTIYEFEEFRNKATPVDETPFAFTDITNKLYVYPVPRMVDEVENSVTINKEKVGYIELTYYALPNAISGDCDRNWILDVAPDAYFYGCMSKANQYVRDFEVAEYWENKFNKSVDIIQAWADQAEEAGGPIVIQGG